MAIESTVVWFGNGGNIYMYRYLSRKAFMDLPNGLGDLSYNRNILKMPLNANVNQDNI